MTMVIVNIIDFALFINLLNIKRCLEFRPLFTNY